MRAEEIIPRPTFRNDREIGESIVAEQAELLRPNAKTIIEFSIDAYRRHKIVPTEDRLVRRIFAIMRRFESTKRVIALGNYRGSFARRSHIEAGLREMVTEEVRRALIEECEIDRLAAADAA
jgi:hypothetical protein